MPVTSNPNATVLAVYRNPTPCTVPHNKICMRLRLIYRSIVSHCLSRSGDKAIKLMPPQRFFGPSLPLLLGAPFGLQQPARRIAGGALGWLSETVSGIATWDRLRGGLVLGWLRFRRKQFRQRGLIPGAVSFDRTWLRRANKAPKTDPGRQAPEPVARKGSNARKVAVALIHSSRSTWMRRTPTSSTKSTIASLSNHSHRSLG